MMPTYTEKGPDHLQWCTKSYLVQIPQHCSRTKPHIYKFKNLNIATFTLESTKCKNLTDAYPQESRLLGEAGRRLLGVGLPSQQVWEISLG
jgi:hypothetical protein